MDEGTPTEPKPLAVRMPAEEDTIYVEYLDDHIVRYRGPFETHAPPIHTQPGRRIHVLLVEPDGSTGRLLYINEFSTAPEILSDTGVGRVFVDADDQQTLFDGIEAHSEGQRVVIDVDQATVEGRVFVITEDQFETRTIEVTPDGA